MEGLGFRVQGLGRAGLKNFPCCIVRGRIPSIQGLLLLLHLYKADAKVKREACCGSASDHSEQSAKISDLYVFRPLATTHPKLQPLEP